MAKVILGKRPESISYTIKAQLPTGTIGHIKASYVYRTRTEFGEMIDQRVAEAKAQDEAAESAYQLMLANLQPGEAVPPRPNTSPGDLQRRACESCADYLLANLTAWDLDSPLNRESLLQLCAEAPAMAQALMDGYRAACVEGRLGN